MMAWLTVALLMTASAGLWRLLRGPGTADRLLAIQMLGTTSISVLLVLSYWKDAAYLRDVALILALLGAVISAALVQLLRPPHRDPGDNVPEDFPS